MKKVFVVVKALRAIGGLTCFQMNMQTKATFGTIFKSLLAQTVNQPITSQRLNESHVDVLWVQSEHQDEQESDFERG